MSRRLLLPTWCAVLALALVALHLLGDTDLGMPLQPTAWADHLAEVGPAAVIVGALRLLAMGLAWYLVVVTVAGALTRAAGRRVAVAATDAVSPRFVRRLLASAGGLAISGAGLALATAPIAIGVDPVRSSSAASLQPQAIATFRQFSPVVVPVPSVASPHAADAVSNGDDGASTAELAALELSGPGATLAETASGTVDQRPDDTWEVDCGDHLWLIAQEVLAEPTGVVPSDEVVTEYWLTLIAANRDRLVAPQNPDLLIPGQVLTIPAPALD